MRQSKCSLRTKLLLKINNSRGHERREAESVHLRLCSGEISYEQLSEYLGVGAITIEGYRTTRE